MRTNFKTRLLASSLLVGAAAYGAPAFAQEVADPAVNVEEQEIRDDPEDIDPTMPVTAPTPAQEGTIVVTGSRIRQDTFNSPTPIQVLDADQAARVGVTSATELLQRSTIASGQQIDATINTNAGNSNATEAPPSGGTGSSNIDLRGLGIERTLVLVNGRRLGAAGVRGAPSQPDIGLLPLGLIERIDVVTEGASSIYGADAVAGVVNVILKTEFEGLELFGHVERPEHPGGDVEQVSAIIGTSGDRARIMAGVEFYQRARVRTGDREFSRALRTIIEDEDGNVFIRDTSGFFDNIISAPGVPGAGAGFFILFTPGTTNIGVPNFSAANENIPGTPPGYFDRCELGLCYANFIYHDFYNDQDERRAADLVQPLKRYSFVASGSYDLDQRNDIKAYFEAYYFDRQQRVRGASEQIYPDIPAEIPQLDEDGRVVGYVDNPLNPFDTIVNPIITLDDIPQIFDVNVTQHRLVGGIQGNIPGDFFEERGWNFDLSWSFDRGVGFQAQTILFEPHIHNVTQGVYLDANGNLGCTPLSDTVFGFFSLPQCPIVNFFNPVFYTGGPTGEGTFENQAQRDYLLGNRTNRTVLEQTIYAAYISGDLFRIPWGGTVKFAAGYEHRDDEIDSQNSLVGVMGLNAAENPVTEGETRGGRNLDEVYAEIQLPLIQDRPFADLLQVDGAVRYTHESNFGDEITYRARGLWRPVSWVQLSGSYGTSYRAPNLREQFLAAQGGGIGGQTDPCINVNIQARIVGSNQGASDPAVQHLIQNCIADGVVFTDSDGDGVLDQTTLGTGGITTIPVVTGGNEDLLPETSRSYTATLSISPPIFGPADVDFAISYYDIKINNSVQNLGGATIIGRCYNDLDFPNLTSSFCGFIDRATDVAPSARLIREVRAGFVNIGEESVKGIDINARARIGFNEIGAGLPDAVLRIAGTVTHQWERNIQVFEEDDVTELDGRIGFPKWKGQVTAAVETGPWQVTTQVNYIGSSTGVLLNQNFTPSSIVEGRPLTRPVFEVPAQWFQDLSLTFEQDYYSITAGVQNLWDNEPPLVHQSITPNRNNAVTQSGYDFIGRTFFINGRVRF